jgi:hypothetical protein
MEEIFSLDALKTRIDGIYDETLSQSDQTLSYVVSDTMFELTAISDKILKKMQTDIQTKKQDRLSVNEIKGIEEFIKEYLVSIQKLDAETQEKRGHDRRDSIIQDVLISTRERIQEQHLRLINASNGLKTGQPVLLAKTNILNIIGTLIQSNDTCMRSLYIALNPVLGGGILRRRRRKQIAVTYKKVANRKKQRRNTKKQHRIK